MTQKLGNNGSEAVRCPDASLEPSVLTDLVGKGGRKVAHVSPALSTKLQRNDTKFSLNLTN
jgi:hypothetical protein